MDIKNIAVKDLIPYEKNTKKHDDVQINNVAESIKQYGFVQPIVIDKNNVVVIGHCRLLAAKKLKMADVPCVCVEDLTEEQVKALRIVDNKSNESPWDFDFLADELADLDLSDFDFDFGIDTDAEEETEIVEDEAPEVEELDEQERIFKERMASGELSDDDEEYQAFLEKFEAKKTTDDCYTPDNIYNAVKKWCVEKYGLQGKKFIRPFYPNGDYQKEDYSGDCIVLDNPPFSIISEICEWYTERGIKFFMFAPTLTLLGIARGTMKYVACGAGVTYENGANVNTSFVTNLGDKKIIASAELREIVEEVNKENLRKLHKELPKYSYPDEVLTATMLCYMAAHGTSLEIEEKDTYFIRALDSQKESGKGLFGSGFLLSEKATSEKAAAEKAAAEKVDTNIWELSDREREIVKSLGK
jgi:ParB-like chromosome segregation protein Spo0J